MAGVRKALKQMKIWKATARDDISIVGESWLTRLFNKILMTKKMPDGWRSIAVRIKQGRYLLQKKKKKGNIQNCTNYRVLNLWVVLWSYGRAMEQCLRQKTKVFENQFGFMPGRLRMEAIFSCRQLMEKYRANRKNLHLVFIDVEKAYDKGT